MTQDRNNLSPSEALVLILIVLAIGGSCVRASYGECRRVHPRWYCVMEQFR